MRLWSWLVALACIVATPVLSAEYRVLRLDGQMLKWGPPEIGAPAEVSWGFTTAHEVFANAVNCGWMAPMALMSDAWGGDPARLERIAAEAFAMWSGASGIVFRRAAPGQQPDILIGAQAEPRRIAFANVWHDAAAARDGVAPLRKATICFNPDRAWSTRLGLPPKGAQDFRTVLAHEIGHAIGLDHPGAAGTLMGFADQGPLDGLAPGDAAGVRLLYGERRADAPSPSRVSQTEGARRF
jgi:hypothetical protein